MKGIEIILLVAGAALGALLRYKMVQYPILLGSLQANILIVNAAGSFILGMVSVISLMLNLDKNIHFLLRWDSAAL